MTDSRFTDVRVHPDDRLNRVLINVAKEDAALGIRILDAITDRTNRDQAADQVMTEALIGISFGLVNYAQPADRALFRDLAAMYATTAFGQPWNTHYAADIHADVTARLVAATSLPGDVAHLAATALSGLQSAAHRHSDDSLNHTLAWVVHAWVDRATGQGSSDPERAMQHRTVLTWVTETLVQAIHNSEEITP